MELNTASECTDCDCEVKSCDAMIPLEEAKPITTKGVKFAKKVLDESRYVNEIEKIIVRDFFPDLPKLMAQSEYRKAMEDNDFKKMRELQFKYRIKTNRMGTDVSFANEPQTPSTFETPLTDHRQDNDIHLKNNDKSHANDKSEKPTDDGHDDDKTKNISLDKFLNKYTSEDNASFEVIQEEETKKHRIKYPWLYVNEQKIRDETNESLALPTVEQQAIGDDQKNLLTWNYKNINSVMYNPDGAVLTSQEKLAYVKRESVVHENTRFVVMPFNEHINKAAIAHAAHIQAKQKEGKIGIDGKELVPNETPQINGFKFVPMTPSPAPGVVESPFMTWGEIEGTPFRLDGSDTPLPNCTSGTSQFRIPDVPPRDKLALSLVDKVSRHHRDKKRHAFKTVQSSLSQSSPSSFSSSKTPLERLNSMSPAAQRLATIKLGLHKSTDRTLLKSYSPARNSRISTPNLTPKIFDSPVTPLNVPLSKGDSEKGFVSSSITDNLLKLPKRHKAADYF